MVHVKTGKMAGMGLAQVRKKSWLRAYKWYLKDTFKIPIKFRNNSFLNMFIKFNGECKIMYLTFSTPFIWYLKQWAFFLLPYYF